MSKFKVGQVLQHKTNKDLKLKIIDAPKEDEPHLLSLDSSSNVCYWTRHLYSFGRNALPIQKSQRSIDSDYELDMGFALKKEFEHGD